MPVVRTPKTGKVKCLNEVRPRRPEQSAVKYRRAMLGLPVSMKSGLEGRNNFSTSPSGRSRTTCLNEVRPRRPEQYRAMALYERLADVSMKSGLEGRNNLEAPSPKGRWVCSLNEVRPRRPEQCVPCAPGVGYSS